MNWMDLMTGAGGGILSNLVTQALGKVTPAEYDKTACIAMWAYPALIKGVPPELGLMYGQEIIPDPHLVPVTLMNEGRSDIETADFDAGESVTITVEGKIRGRLAVTDEKCHVKVSKAYGDITIDPIFMRRGHYVGALLLMEGKPNPVATVVESLRGTRVLNLTALDADALRYSYLHGKPFGLPSLIEHHNLRVE